MHSGLDLKDLAKYPFLREAQEFVARRDTSFEDFIQSNYGRNALNHATDRVIAAVQGTKGNPEIIDAETDLFSYALARVLVSCIGERGVIERHARHEAARCAAFLTDEDPELYRFVAENLGFAPEIRRMAVTEYVRLIAALREPDWRLINRRVEGGWVEILEGEMEVLMRERIRSLFLRQLPLPVPESLCSRIAPLARVVESSYQEQILQHFGDVDEGSFPPCITALIQAITGGTNLPHQGRFAITAFLHAVGLTSQEIVELYCRAPDFDIDKTLYQVEHITGARGTEYTAPSCATLRTYGFCVNRDHLCERVNHPLNYYLIRKKAKKAGQISSEEPPVPSEASAGKDSP